MHGHGLTLHAQPKRAANVLLGAEIVSSGPTAGRYMCLLKIILHPLDDPVDGCHRFMARLSWFV